MLTIVPILGLKKNCYFGKHKNAMFLCFKKPNLNLNYVFINLSNCDLSIRGYTYTCYSAHIDIVPCFCISSGCSSIHKYS